ncbi:PREDICTED: LOC110753263 [Prunus dulcis]|uniref:PREDICTED: LOC110753263 n=1 Tax=Prunus dulcis TaxID=3755 RepID=A0A5E4FVE9_PRUDU|nr:PREDICTED: LOC110753263 [Prunus dulcis]
MAAVVHIKEGPISSTKLEIDNNSPITTSRAQNHQLTTFSPWRLTSPLTNDLRTQKMIGLGKRHGNLYYFDPHHLASHLHSSSTYHATVQNNVWHLRLRHPSNAKLHLLSKQFLIFPFLSIFSGSHLDRFNTGLGLRHLPAHCVKSDND